MALLQSFLEKNESISEIICLSLTIAFSIESFLIALKDTHFLRNTELKAILFYLRNLNYEYFKSSHIDGNNDEETLLQKTEKAWQTVKSYFQTFNEWYDDLELYHYVGFLLAVGTIPIKQLVNSWKAKKGKKEFVRYLKDEIKKAIGNNSTDYPYKKMEATSATAAAYCCFTTYRL